MRREKVIDRISKVVPRYCFSLPPSSLFRKFKEHPFVSFQKRKTPVLKCKFSLSLSLSPLSRFKIMFCQTVSFYKASMGTRGIEWEKQRGKSFHQAEYRYGLKNIRINYRFDWLNEWKKMRRTREDKMKLPFSILHDL